jgi:hypothetical protein
MTDEQAVEKVFGSSDFSYGYLSVPGMKFTTFIVTFLARPRKVTERRAPGGTF